MNMPATPTSKSIEITVSPEGGVSVKTTGYTGSYAGTPVVSSSRPWEQSAGKACCRGISSRRAPASRSGRARSN